MGWKVAVVLLACGFGAVGAGEESPIRFTCRELPFVLENSETPTKYAPETMAGGLAVFDYDNDGDLDVFFANGATMPGLDKSSPKYYNRLFRNNGAGGFSDVTGAAGLAGKGYATGAVIGDYDNDGYADLFVAGVHRNTLYHNQGDGTFRDTTAAAKLDIPDEKYGPLWAVGGAWFDFDRDGDLDLFVANYLHWIPEKEPVCDAAGVRDYCHPKYYTGSPDRLFRNNGDGTFTDVSKSTGLRVHVGKAMGVGVADFDGDSWPDLFVTNDKLPNFFFHNLGGKRFEEIAFDVTVALPEHGRDVSGMGVDFRDVDNDGLPDITYAALENETFPLFRNTGKGYFEEVTYSAGLTTQSRTMAGYSPGFFDFDNDGWKDLFVSRGHVQSLAMADILAVDQHNTVFRNLGNGKFTALTDKAGFAAAPPKRHRGAGVADFNGDGRLDIIVSALEANAELWINASPGEQHWLELDLEGTRSNRDAIGAEIKVVSANGTQYNHVSFSVGYASSSAGPVHFGLGRDKKADLVEIRWPSGTMQRLTSVTCDQVLKVREPPPAPAAGQPRAGPM